MQCIASYLQPRLFLVPYNIITGVNVATLPVTHAHIPAHARHHIQHTHARTVTPRHFRRYGVASGAERNNGGCGGRGDGGATATVGRQGRQRVCTAAAGGGGGGAPVVSRAPATRRNRPRGGGCAWRPGGGRRRHASVTCGKGARATKAA